eukprot:CCRYP_019117-RB/>CCRYP_019117-RB protein AED:0.07 eAED:0.07 QI:237/0.87/0.88/1/0.75/0.66/9/271/1508
MEKDLPNAAAVATTPAPPLNIHGDTNPFTLTFHDLSVHVPRVSECLPCCTFRNIKNLGAEYFGMYVTEREAFYTLDRVSGCVKSGETLLVLGKSGSGKSTLLRALCGRLNETDELFGTVALNGIPIGKSHQAWRRMCSYVSADDGTHSPVLTVGETFRFAAQCTSDGKTPVAALEARVDWMLDALGLSHVKNTVVGDENLRGVSGGQKRRVTVGEMLLNPHSRIFCLDNITDGLASTDSLSLVQQISGACKKNGLAAIITLLQPSDEIVQLFDKMLVLSSEGQPMYFGPVNRHVLREVFIGSADPKEEDTGSIADLVLNQPVSNESLGFPDSKEQTVPVTFSGSTLHRDLLQEIDDIRSMYPSVHEREAALDAILPRTKYSNSYWHQLQIIASRRKKLIMRNSMTYARIIIAIIFGTIVGSLFSALNNDTIGALGKTGYIFLSSFLVLMLSAAVTIPDGFRQRITLFKHRNAEFYSGRIAYIVQWALDMPLSIIEATLIASISYWWVDMTPGANHFLLFLFTLIGLECVGQAFARVLCALSRTQVSANVASSLFILLFATVGGFMPTYDAITWVLRWLSWLTPVSYAFEAMMINQFEGQTFYGVVIVNPNVGSTSIGTVQGTKYLQAQSLPRSQWTTNHGIMVFDCIMLFIFAFVLDVIGMFFQEKTRSWYFNQIRRPRSKVHRAALVTPSDPEAQSLNTYQGGHSIDSLSVKNLCYSVNIEKNSPWKPRRATLQSLCGPLLTCLAGKEAESKEATGEDPGISAELSLLNNITARFRKGRMCALMGQSGAGKTTLLDVIAGYKTGGKITGDIMIDGQPKLDATWKVISAYAEQQDILNPYMSVRETIEFTAACRLPNSSDRKAIIDNVMELMDLLPFANMIVGREKEGEGLPKHARKRLTIANQLVVQPKILFLDEPTSGLGVNAAALVMRAVRRSTDALDLITLVTIHQPSRKMFESFDDLLLLAKGGRVSYCGELGKNSKTLLDYFANLSGKEPPSNVNPADFVLGILDDGSPDNVVSLFQECILSRDIVDHIESDINSAEGKEPLIIHGNSRTFFLELTLLFKRQFLVQWRNPSYSFMRMTVSAGACVILGLLFFNIESNVQGAVFSIASLFFMTFILVIPMQSAVIPLIEDRSVLYREAVSGTYSRLAYGLGQLLADIPFHAINTLIMVRQTLQQGQFDFIPFCLTISRSSVWNHLLYANGLAGLSVILSVCLMGFLITSSAMPDGWAWAYQVNLFRYILQGLVTNELSGQTYRLDIGHLIPEMNTTMSSISLNENNMLGNVFDDRKSNFKAIGFVHGDIPVGGNYSAQAARLVGVTLDLDGENVGDDFNSLISCLVENECLVEPVSTNFINCTSDFSSVCANEFDQIISNLEDGKMKVAECFGGDNSYDGATTVLERDLEHHHKVASCMMRRLLPIGGSRHVLRGFRELMKIIMFIQDIIENGIDIPGDAILFYFGWSEFDADTLSFSAPWKWYYCVTAVVVFLLSMELIKLVAVQCIVWTKR